MNQNAVMGAQQGNPVENAPGDEGWFDEMKNLVKEIDFVELSTKTYECFVEVHQHFQAADAQRSRNLAKTVKFEESKANAKKAREMALVIRHVQIAMLDDWISAIDLDLARLNDEYLGLQENCVKHYYLFEAIRLLLANLIGYRTDDPEQVNIKLELFKCSVLGIQITEQARNTPIEHLDTSD
ncbi:unnamed protein product, partial [Mesorhabditis spiculigera]